MTSKICLKFGHVFTLFLLPYLEGFVIRLVLCTSKGAVGGSGKKNLGYVGFCWSEDVRESDSYLLGRE